MNFVTLVLFFGSGVAIAITIPNPVVQALLHGINACDTEDPLLIDPGPINITADPFLVINIGSKQFGAVVTGLSGLVSELLFDLMLMQLSFKVTLPYAHVEGDRYVATGSINADPFRPETIPSGPFSGDGQFEASINDLVIMGKAIVKLLWFDDRVTLRSITVDHLTFSKVFAELGGFVINGSPHDFDEWNADFKTNFDTDFATPAIKDEILDKVTNFFNEYIGGKFNLRELLEFINRPTPTCPPRYQ